MFMQITDIKFRKIFETEPLVAICSITFDDSIVVHDLKLVKTGGKTMVAMPSRKRADGSFTDIVHPINSEMRNLIESEVLNAYNKLTKN
jgi:stage V sporulation protein G